MILSAACRTTLSASRKRLVRAKDSFLFRDGGFTWNTRRIYPTSFLPDFHALLFSSQSQVTVESNIEDAKTMYRPTRTEIRKMKVVSLREELARRGLSTDGIRNDLVLRLIDEMHGASPGVARKRTIRSSLNKGGLSFDPGRVYVLRIRAHAPCSVGESGVGFVMYDQEEVREVWTARKYFSSVQTRFQAEYRGLMLAFQYISKRGVKRLVLQTDNAVVLRQLSGEYQVRKSQLKKLYWATVSLLESFDEFRSNPISAVENSRAGNLAKRAVATRKSIGVGPEVDETVDAPNEDDAKSFPAQLSADRTYLLRFDGGARGNPGVAGSGMVLYSLEDKAELWCGWKYLGDNATNNEAEYTGLMLGLQCAVSLGVKRLVVEGDSQLVVRQLKGLYRVKSGKLEGYYQSSKDLMNQLQFSEIRHICRADNSRADELANHAMDTQQSFGFEEN